MLVLFYSLISYYKVNTLSIYNASNFQYLFLIISSLENILRVKVI